MDPSKTALSIILRICLSSLVMLVALLAAINGQSGGGALTSDASLVFSDSFEDGLQAWAELTRTAGNRATITTSLTHTGLQAVALLLNNLTDAGYVALSHTLPTMTNVRIRSWVYDFDNDWSGAMEVYAPQLSEPRYAVLAIPPRHIFTDSYGLRFNGTWVARAAFRSPGWHAFDLLVTDDGTMARIDEQTVESHGASTNLPWIHTDVTQTGTLRLISPWTVGTQIYDDVEVTIPPSTTDNLILAVKDDFLRAYGATDFSPIYHTLGQITTTPCLPDMRSLAGTAMAFALDARTSDNGTGSAGRVSYSLQRATQLISDIITYGQWAYDDINTVGLYNCNSLTTYELALSSWMIWWSLPPELRAAVKARVIADAERYVSQPPRSGYVGDTKAEENAWTAKFLALAANMFPFEPRASAWDMAARCFAFHSITNQPSTYCGYTTQTVHPDFTLDNHGISPNPFYMDAVLQELAGGALAYRANTHPVPLEFVHNVPALWNRHKTNIDWGRTYYYLTNPDWGSQGWHWMGGTVAAFLSLEPRAYASGYPLVTSAEELDFLRTRWLINSGRVAILTEPVAAITETSFAPGSPSYAWFLNTNQLQDGYIWGYLYHHPELLERTTLLTHTIFMPTIARSLTPLPSSFTAWQPALSPDSQLVVFTGQSNGEHADIYLMNIRGGGLRNLTRTPETEEANPVFSPDGSTIAFASNQGGEWDIYLMDRDGVHLRPLVSSVGSNEIHPAFSPDGLVLAFSSDREAGNWDIYTVPVTGGMWARLTTSPDFEGYPAFSANGKQLFYSMVTGNNAEIYTIDLATGNPQWFTGSPGFDGYPVPVPDGSGVVFVSDRSGELQLYSINTGGTGILSLTHQSGYRAHTPRLSSDGHILIYAAGPADGTYKIYTMTYRSPLETLADQGAADTLGICDWTAGVFALGWAAAWRSTGNDAYARKVKDWVDSCAIHLRTVTHVNDGLLGYAALVAYQFDHQPIYLAFAQRVADYLMHTAPRTANGTLMHFEDSVWIDTLISVIPFLTEMGRVTGKQSYIDEAAAQMMQHAIILQDPSTGLYRHAWRESTNTYLSSAYWTRGNGWAMIAEAQLLAVLPYTHTLRSSIVRLMQDQARALAARQDISGLWHTVVTRPDFYLESSGSAGIAYGLQRGIAEGWLPADLAPNVQIARLGLWRKVSADGTLTDTSSPTGPMMLEDEYNIIPNDAMQLYGQGLGLLALSYPIP